MCSVQLCGPFLHALLCIIDTEFHLIIYCPLLFNIMNSCCHCSQAALVLITPQKRIESKLKTFYIHLFKDHFWVCWKLRGAPCETRRVVSLPCAPFSAGLSRCARPQLVTRCETLAGSALRFFESLLMSLMKSFLQIQNTFCQSTILTLFRYIHRPLQRNLTDSSLCSSMYSPSPSTITVPINVPDRITDTLRDLLFLR